MSDPFPELLRVRCLALGGHRERGASPRLRGLLYEAVAFGSASCFFWSWDLENRRWRTVVP